MCGIVGAVAQRNVAGILLEGLKRLEYRGYDSAGMVVVNQNGSLTRQREVGKVAMLESILHESPLTGKLGIAHTRWATHGKPAVRNAHPHMSGDRLAIVHNGIIENFEVLKDKLEVLGYHFESETDTEVVAHLLNECLKTEKDTVMALRATIQELTGAFALAVVNGDSPDELVAVREGSPLVIGVGIDENFLASDPLALLQVTDRFIYLEEGDIARITRESVIIWDNNNKVVQRPVQQFEHGLDGADKGHFRHFMMKEIFEQPKVIAATLEGRISGDHVLERVLGADADEVLSGVGAVQIVACGTSYHSGLVARYWIEDLAGIPCQVEVASEYRYRKHVVCKDTLFVTLSQSGETADTLAALRQAKKSGFKAAISICNVPGSSLVRESDLTVMTLAGPEIGVASTKAFTTQLVALLIITIALAKRTGLTREKEGELVQALKGLPALVQRALELNEAIKKMSEAFAEKHNSLFLGRGSLYPIAMEGALKLKEISYIHAEAYPAGELKHGPLALIDKNMPVVTVAPNNQLLEKLKSNLQEVRARGGELYVFADAGIGLHDSDGIHVIGLPAVHEILAPILYTIPLQLLSYHVAVLKGTDVDQPRNLAKSVTVE
jgi:glucosamine--fructose-6-phosphate aminotransferase (isomerizing)